MREPRGPLQLPHFVYSEIHQSASLDVEQKWEAGIRDLQGAEHLCLRLQVIRRIKFYLKKTVLFLNIIAISTYTAGFHHNRNGLESLPIPRQT